MVEEYLRLVNPLPSCYTDKSVEVFSKNKRKIRLTGERLNHILTNHPEMVEFILDIPKVIEEPDIIFQGRKQEYIAVRGSNHYFLVVIYKEGKDDGFVITAFRTRSIAYLLKRKIVWKKH